MASLQVMRVMSALIAGTAGITISTAPVMTSISRAVRIVRRRGAEWMMNNKAYAEKVKHCVDTIEKLRRHMRTEGLLETTENADIDFAIGILIAQMVLASMLDFTEGDE